MIVLDVFLNGKGRQLPTSVHAPLDCFVMKLFSTIPCHLVYICVSTKERTALGQVTDRISAFVIKTEHGILPAFGELKTKEETKNNMKTFCSVFTAIIHTIYIHAPGRGEKSGDIDTEPETEASSRSQREELTSLGTFAVAY